MYLLGIKRAPLLSATPAVRKVSRLPRRSSTETPGGPPRSSTRRSRRAARCCSPAASRRRFRPPRRGAESISARASATVPAINGRGSPSVTPISSRALRLPSSPLCVPTLRFDPSSDQAAREHHERIVLGRPLPHRARRDAGHPLEGLRERRLRPSRGGRRARRPSRPRPGGVESHASAIGSRTASPARRRAR